MRVVVTQLAGTAHINLTVPLGWALKNAGHDVVMAVQPDFIPVVEQTGLTGVAVGEEARYAERLAALAPEETIYGSGYDMTEMRPEVLTYEYVRGFLAAFASPLALDLNTDETVYDDLVEFCRSWRPDLVVWDSMTFTGPVAAAVCGAAHVRATIGRDHWARMRELFLRLRAERPEAADEDPVRDWMSAKLAKYGAVEFTEELVLGQATLDTVPSWMRIPSEYTPTPMRYIAYNGPGSIPEWLQRPDPERPRVCLTAGATMQEVWDGRRQFSFDDLFEAVGDLDVEIVALFDRSSVPEGTSVPDNIRFPGFVPLHPLLRTCSGIIHHAGTGSTLTALINGLPQLIIPNALHDEPLVAQSVHDHGVGVHLPPEQLDAQTLRAGLLRILNEPSFSERAEQVRREMEQVPSPNHLVEELEELVARKREATALPFPV